MSNAYSWSWCVRIGTGKTIESAIEHALDSAKLPPPLRFEVLQVEGVVTADKNLWYQVRVKIRAEEPTKATEQGGEVLS